MGRAVTTCRCSHGPNIKNAEFHFETCDPAPKSIGIKLKSQGQGEVSALVETVGVIYRMGVVYRVGVVIGWVYCSKQYYVVSLESASPISFVRGYTKHAYEIPAFFLYMMP